MGYCLADYLTVITPYLSPELVSTLTLSKMQVIAQKLQPTWGGLLECYLSPNTAGTDFSVELLNTAINLEEGIEASSVWQRIQQVCLSCTNPTATTHETESIWLEFALDGELSEITIPSVFLSLGEERLQYLNDNPANVCSWLTEKAIEPILGQILSVQLQQNLRVCLEALPINAQVLYVGVMLSEQNSTIRLNISGIPPLEISEYLVEIGWTGSATELEAIALNLQSLVDRIVLNFDIGMTVASKVGLECFVDRHLEKNSQWQPLLNYLVSNKLSTPEKCQALLAWPGFCDEQSSPVPWPRNLTAISNFLGKRASSILVRELNHIELILISGNSLEAKGYLWFGSDWIVDEHQ